MNHWAQQCRSSGRRNSSTGHSPSPGRPQNRQRRFSGNKPNKGRGRGGGSGNQKSTPKRPGGSHGRGGGKPFKTNALTVTGLPGPQHPPKVDSLGGNETKESVSMNTGLSRPAQPPKVSGEPFINTFASDALTSNGNELCEPPSNQGKAYTDTDGKTEIITDITCKFKGKLVAMEVKVDPGSETNCIPLSHFRHLFPQLCRKDGNPKENALEPTLAQFEAYDGGIMTSHGWIILPTRDIRDSSKFHPVRYYVVTREEARILISHATATWLGLVKVLCPNKAPRIKRQVASVSKKAREPLDSSNSNSLSGPEHPPKVKYFYNNDFTTPQHPPKVKYTGMVMVNEQQYKRPTSRPRSHGRKHRRGKPAHREEEGQVANRSVEFQSFLVDTKGAKSMGRRQSMLPRRISTSSQSEIKSLSNNHYCSSTTRTSTPSQSEISGFLPECPFYQPQEDQETYYINSEGHLQCHQDSQNIIKAPTPQELPGSKERPTFHKPGSIKISSVEDLLKLYPNSFDWLGSLKGEYDIKVDPTVPPVQNARRKVPIESKAAIKEAIDYMVKQDILEPQIEPTPWVSSVTYPVKPTGEVRPCLDARDLNKAIIWENMKPQTVEEIAHQLAGAVVFTKADALKAFLQVHLTEESSKLLVINTHKGQYRFKRMPFGAKMSQDVFQMKMDLIMERCPGVISIYDDIVVYGVSDEDHDANLINLLNVAQVEGLVLNNKKLELKCPRVSFFGVEYSADGMHPCPKKIQGIPEMTPPIDKQQLSSFIGMVTYMGNFVPHLSHHTEPLRAMVKQDAVFAWDEVANASFQKIKDLIAKSATKPLAVLWPKEASDSTGRCLPKRTWCLLATGGRANCICQQEPHRHWDQVCQHRKRAPCHCICLSAVQHLCSGKALHSGVRPQATGNDTSEEPCKCPSQTPANAPSATAIWCGHQVLTREGNAAHRCTEQVPLTSFWGNQTGYESRLHCLQQGLDSQTQGNYEGRPHSWHSVPAYSAGVATSKEAYSQDGKGILVLQRPALYRWGTAVDGSQNSHSVLPPWGVSSKTLPGPSLSN